MNSKLNNLYNYLLKRKMTKYARMVERMSGDDNTSLLDNVPDDVIAFMIAFLEVCKDSLGHLKTLHSDLNDLENSSDDKDFDEDKESEEDDLSEEINLKDLMDKRKDSATERKRIMMDAEKNRKSVKDTIDLFDLENNSLLTEDISMVHQFMLKERPRAAYWYDDFRKYMLDNIFDGNDSSMLAKTFYRILAATSVQRNPKLILI